MDSILDLPRILQLDTKTCIRLGLVIFPLIWLIASSIAAKKIRNEILLRMIAEGWIFFLFLAIARIVATYIDSKLAYDVGIFTTCVTYGFNIYITWCVIRFNMSLNRPKEIHITGTNEIIQNPMWINPAEGDEALDQMFKAFKIRDKNLNQAIKLAQKFIK